MNNIYIKVINYNGDIMKINFKKLLLYIVITFFIGSFFAFFINSGSLYNNLNKAINVPSIIFPIVWTILYLIMATSAYIVSESNNINKNNAIKLYFFQLIINSLWTLIFFGLKLYILSFIWLILLIILVIIMIIKFYNIVKIAGILNIFYLVWLLFALYLNLSIVLLN